MDKVLLVARVFPPKIGGIENYIYNIFTRLEEAVVVTPHFDGCEAFDRRQSINIKRVAIKPGVMRQGKLPLFFLFFAALKYGRQFKPVQIHCDQVQSGFIGYLLHLLLRKPYIVYTYGMEISGGGARIMKTYVLKRAQKVITISQFSKDSLVSRFKVPASKIMLVPPGTDVHRFCPGIDYSQILRHYRLENKKIIFSVGRLDKDCLYKNFTSVIQIMSRIVKKIPEAVYVIAGAGDDLNRLKRLAKESGVSDKIIFTGRLSDSDLVKMYNACDVFVMVSKSEVKTGKVRGEGFGIVYLEANACGKPVVAGNVCGAVEAVINNVTGLLVNPDNRREIEAAIIELLTNRELSMKLGKQGRKRVQTNFTWEKNREKIQKLLSTATQTGTGKKTKKKLPIKTKLRLSWGSLDIGQRIRQQKVVTAVDKLNPNGKNILDAGCGCGWSALSLAAEYPNAQITGLDLNPAYIAAADNLRRRLALHNLEFRQADLSRPFARRHFDVIYCVDVMEHIKEDGVFLDNLFLALKPGGSLLLHVPLSEQNRYFKRFRDWRQSDHVRRGYRENKLYSLMTGRGFEIIDKQYTFGQVGSLAWEIYESARRSGEFMRVTTSLMLRPLIAFDTRFKNKRGNAVLISAKKMKNENETIGCRKTGSLN